MKTKILLLACAMCVMAVNQTLIAQGLSFRNLNLSEALALGKKQGKTVFVECYADWCRPCKLMEKEVFPDPELGQALNNFICVRINVDEEEGASFCDSLGISSIPAFVFLPEQDKVKIIEKGYRDVEEMKELAQWGLNPNTHPYYIAMNKYENGKCSREELIDLVSESFDRNEDAFAEKLCTEVLGKFTPDADTIFLNRDMRYMFYITAKRFKPDPYFNAYVKGYKKHKDKLEEDYDFVKRWLYNLYELEKGYIGEDTKFEPEQKKFILKVAREILQKEDYKEFAAML
jgi:thiol-disulfide isomerase/thioredoxin